MNRKKILFFILAIAVLLGGGFGGYYWYEGAYYVKTEDSRIAADIYRVMPRISGKLTALQVNDGDLVVKDQIVAQQDTNNLTTGMLDQAAMRAPISGKVIKTQAKVGEVVSPGQTVAMVVDSSKLYISANIEETSLHRIKVGQKVDITVDTFSDSKLTGTVSEIGEATASTFSLLPAMSTSGNFTKVTQRVPIKISIDDQQGLSLAPGLSTVIKIHAKG